MRPVRLTWCIPVVAGGLLACCAAAPAASIQYLSHYHADDVGVGSDPDVHQHSFTFDTVTASIPAVASSTSTLAGSDSGFTFAADQVRTDANFPWVHTLLSLSFVPSSDMLFTFAGEYDVRRQGGAAAATNVAIYLDLGDVTTGEVLIQYELNDHVSADTMYQFPAPSTSVLLANHKYFLFLEAFNDTYPGHDGGTTAAVRLALTAVPLPRAAAMGGVALALLPLRRRRIGAAFGR